MAKSLRSKWRRKMRAIKRERYGKKELERLKKMLGIEDGNNEVEMKNLSEIATVVDAKSIQKDVPEEEGGGSDVEEKTMELEQSGPKRSKRTLRDENGHYPIWMSRREVKKRALHNKIIKKQARKQKIKEKKKKKGRAKK